ncbi:hypothetical protein V8G54_029885 [Vigna mungo]|uniref:Transposase n=1 Tax=Vigna mungo TaxID=3915 RepID=A0AAQ3MU68_VIGMU
MSEIAKLTEVKIGNKDEGHRLKKREKIKEKKSLGTARRRRQYLAPGGRPLTPGDFAALGKPPGGRPLPPSGGAIQGPPPGGKVLGEARDNKPMISNRPFLPRDRVKGRPRKQRQDISRNEDESQETFHFENLMETMINETFGHYRSQPLGEDDVINERPRENHNEFNEFLNDENQILCDESNDKAMTMILDFLRDAFSEAKLPLSFYEAKKIIEKLGLNYTKVGACSNHYMLYLRDDEKDLQTCKHYGTSRWNPKKKKKQPAKNKDGVIRHPRDGEAWKTFSVMHHEFALDPRNVRLGLASDGFNPFGTTRSTYSIWPMFLIPYNLPPWLCMKHTSLILSMIIPGKQMPGNSIDVYLQPLLDELRELWNDGVETFDSSLNETFRMQAALM